MSGTTNNNDINFNSMDDMGICLFLVDENVPIKQNAFFVNNFRKKLDNMKRREFFILLTNINEEFCEFFSNYIKEIVLSFSKSDIEKLLYRDKHSHSISKLAKWLVIQDWFSSQQNEKYKNFFIAYKLEELLKSGPTSKEELESLGGIILEELFDDGHNPELNDLILKHYINLLENYYQEFIPIFKIQGYKIINSHLNKNSSINQNIIIFFCHMIRLFSGIKGSRFFGFYDDHKADIIALHDMYKIELNLSGIKKAFEMFNNEMVTLQYIFFTLGHELNHAYDLEYRHKPKEERNNPVEEVKEFNVGQAETLFRTKSREYNLEYHDKYFNEYCCDIAGIKIVQEQQKLLSCIKDEDKIAMNKYFANKLLQAYSWKDGDEIVYISPAEFTRFTFLDIKDDIPKYAKSSLLDGQMDITPDMREIEQSLDDYDRLLMGYYTPYIGVLKLIADGTITTTDLLGNIPILYEQYHEQIDGKFPSYYATELFNSKKDIIK